MSFTAIKPYAVAVSVALGIAVSGHAEAKKPEAPPYRLQDPVLGLRFDARAIKFDVLPADVAPKCIEYAGTTQWAVGQLLVFAEAPDVNRTYYVVGGYRKRLHPRRSEDRYEIDQFGGVISLEGDQCHGYGQAREVFNARYFEEVPEHVLQLLARNYAARLEQAFGGADLLRKELEKQGINTQSLPLELRTAIQSVLE